MNQLSQTTKKKLLFISDFDRTITEKDFYWILLDDYIGAPGIEYYHEWKKTQKIGTEFLNIIFGWKEFTEDEKNEAISKVQVDEQLKDVVQWVYNREGDFWILSAGFDVYIQKVLQRIGLEDIPILTNHGSFKNGKFTIIPDLDSPNYSPIYGIDKGKVVYSAKNDYQQVIFAGDSEPDYNAAVNADIIFAKDELADLLKLNQINYYAYTNFGDILSQLNHLIK